MAKLSSSYQGAALHIDLESKKSYIEEIPKNVFHKLLGGKGLGILFLLKTPKNIKPLGPKNDLIFFTGPLT